MSDYSVKISVRNGRILGRMRELGIESQKELARLAGVHFTVVNSFVAIRRAGRNSNGKWPDAILAISAALKCMPEDLFTERQAHGKLETNTIETSLSENEMISLAGGQDFESAIIAKETVAKLMEGVPEREKYVVTQRMGGASFDEIGQEIGVCRARAAQLDARAIHRMKMARTRFNRSVRP